MNRFAALSPLQQQRLEQAAQWLVRLQDDPAQKKPSDFYAWVADPANAEAFRAVDEGWRQTVACSAMPEFLSMRKCALARARSRGLWNWRHLTRIAAVILIMLLSSGGIAYIFLAEPSAIATAVGERRIVPLPDGSRILLDSASKVRIRYSRDLRRIDLVNGRARFDVAHDASRPFVVVAGNQHVIAVGTNFNVERLKDRVIVTLIQGKVVVKGKPLSNQFGAVSRQTTLRAGERLIARINATPVVSETDLQAEAAWENGRLVFDNEPLDRAVQRVNRYTDHPITVAPEVSNLRVSGVFNAGDIGAFLGAITAYFPVWAVTSEDGGTELVPSH